MPVEQKTSNHSTLVILAAGASSRMKKSPAGKGISSADAQQANSRSKGLISVGNQGRPLLDYILYNAYKAGYRRIVLVVGEDYSAFQRFYGAQRANNAFHGLSISYAIQHIYPGRQKPFGTADAVLQALEQYPDLQSGFFTVCNSDNLYSINALRKLRQTESPNALILYDRNGLKFSPERILKFALMAVDSQFKLEKIIEKPLVSEVENYRDKTGIVRVSMNIFKFAGSLIYSSLQNCPVTPGRDEKEIPTAIMNMLQENPGSVLGIPLNEHVPDLTEKRDIAAMRKYLQDNYKTLDWP